MKRLFLTVLMISTAPPAMADDPAKHREGAGRVAEDQDELSADVQQLAIEQTVPKVIELLQEVESIMDEATDLLFEGETGGATIAAQTEIIEKIHDAAQERQKQQGGGPSGGAMMDMLQRMLGKETQGGPAGQQPGNAGDQAGLGGRGESDAANENVTGETAGGAEERRVPKAAGTTGRGLPMEFQQALDAYNRGVEAQTE